MKRVLCLLALLSALLLSAAPLPAQDGFYVVGGRPMPGTRINTLPYTISAPGYYYLGGNLTYTGGDGITVNADNITLDLMGFTLTGPNVSSSASAIYIGVGRENVEVRNGTLTGWNCGIGEGSPLCKASRVIGVRAVGNANGIKLKGDGHLIKGCTAFRGRFGEDITVGIQIDGRGTISGCAAGGFRYGIVVGSGTVCGNVVFDCSLLGIYSTGRTVLSHNQVSGCVTGIGAEAKSSIIGNVAAAGSAQTGISPTLGGSSDPVLLDQNNVSGSGTHYGPGNAATVWGANGG